MTVYRKIEYSTLSDLQAGGLKQAAIEAGNDYQVVRVGTITQKTRGLSAYIFHNLAFSQEPEQVLVPVTRYAFLESKGGNPASSVFVNISPEWWDLYCMARNNVPGLQ